MKVSPWLRWFGFVEGWRPSSRRAGWVCSGLQRFWGGIDRQNDEICFVAYARKPRHFKTYRCQVKGLNGNDFLYVEGVRILCLESMERFIVEAQGDKVRPVYVSVERRSREDR